MEKNEELKIKELVKEILKYGNFTALKLKMYF